MRDRIAIAVLMLALGATLGQTLGILPALAANAAQEQQHEIESLRARLERLEARGPRTANRR